MNLMSLIQEGALLWDGAMGTLLMEKGLKKGRPPEEMNLSNPEEVFRAHRSYLEAGAMGVTTNTFGANRIKLREYGLDRKVGEVNRKAAEIAKDACGGTAFVSGSVGPTGKFLKPLGELPFREAVSIFEEQISALLEGGAEAIKIETMLDVRELKAAIVAAKTLSSLPVIAMMTFQDDQRTILGTTPESFGVIADATGADIIGANCSVGPERMVDTLSTIASVTDKPLIGQPNAGIPRLLNGKTAFPMAGHEFSRRVEKFFPSGARIIAGCCGTKPGHIRETRARLGFREKRGVEALPVRKKIFTSLPGLKLASRNRVVSIDLTGPVVMVGERINPTGKKLFARELNEGRMDTVIREAREQEAKGADILDVNVGVPGVDEEMLMEEAIYSVNLHSTLPVMIDSANTSVIERGLEAVDGIPIVNSVTGERKKLKEVLPMAKKFGTPVICLLLDESGIPGRPGERLEVAKRILKEAESEGVKREQLIVDCLATAASSSKGAALCALETVKRIREELGLPVILGISNVSFGLPARGLINRSFLSMAVSCGLNLAIVNPHDKEMVDTIFSGNMLLSKDGNRAGFMERFTDTPKEGFVDGDSGAPYPEITKAIREGRKGEVRRCIEKALSEGADPISVNNDGIVRGLEEIGKLFNSKRVFLPQVIASSEAAEAGFEMIRTQFDEGTEKSRSRVLLATVEGDIHDIGKNIAGALLSGHGFEVIDLGVNVTAEKILREAVENSVDVVGLSALMTTTMMEMEKVIGLLEAGGIDTVTIVGGAVVTEGFARQIGATIYARDAIDGVEKLKKVVEERKNR